MRMETTKINTPKMQQLSTINPKLCDYIYLFTG
jgi:hypothetical protein